MRLSLIDNWTTYSELGDQAVVEGVEGTWRGLTADVNILAANLTTQVRAIAAVTKAVASGDLSKKIDVEANGEIAELKHTINTMVRGLSLRLAIVNDVVSRQQVDQLRLFAEQVTTVSLDVGTRGILGGQARVPGVSGTWKTLTETVNQMATNLTSQVRAIATVTNAIAKGDLSKTIDIEAQGEIADLKLTVSSWEVGPNHL